MKKFFASLVALALGLGLGLAAASPATAQHNVNHVIGSNNEDYWKTTGTGEICAKDDKPGGGTLTTWSVRLAEKLPANAVVTKVIIKAGSTPKDKAYFENTAYYSNATYKHPDASDTTLWKYAADLTASFAHDTGKEISHVTYCWTPSTPTNVQGRASVTDENCAYVDGYITVSITPGVSYSITKNTAPGTPIGYNGAGQTAALPAGNYTVAVSATSTAYTLTTPPSIPLIIAQYPSNCTPQNVQGNAVATNQDCLLDYVDGYITVTLTPGVSYIITKDSDLSQTPIAYNGAGQTAALPTGDYTVAVSATSTAYNLITPASIPLTIAPYTLACGQNTTDPLTTATAVPIDGGCSVSGSYTLSSEQGPGDVIWKADGLVIAAGAHSLPVGGSVRITVEPAPGFGFGFGQLTTWDFSSGESTVCGQFDTLALTGGSNTTPYLFAAGLLGLLGVAVVRSARRQKA